MNGWSPRVENSSDIWHLIISLILISASAYTAWRFSHDMKYTLNQLKEIGIDYVQGFYLDKPKHINKKIEDLRRSMQQRSAMH